MGAAGLGLCCECGASCDACLECASVDCLAFDWSGGGLPEDLRITLRRCSMADCAETYWGDLTGGCVWWGRVHCLELMAQVYSRDNGAGGTECVLRLMAAWPLADYYGGSRAWVWDFVRPDGGPITCEDLDTGLAGVLVEADTTAWVPATISGADITVTRVPGVGYYGYYYSSCMPYSAPTSGVVYIPALTSNDCTHCAGLEGWYCVAAGGGGTNDFVGYALKESPEQQCCYRRIVLTWYCTGEATAESPAALYCRITFGGDTGIVWEPAAPLDIWYALASHPITVPIFVPDADTACCTTNLDAQFDLLQASACEVPDPPYPGWCEDLPAEVTVTIAGAINDCAPINGSWVASYEGQTGAYHTWYYSDGTPGGLEIRVYLRDPDYDSTSHESVVGCADPSAYFDVWYDWFFRFSAAPAPTGPCSGMTCEEVLFRRYTVASLVCGPSVTAGVAA